MKTLIFLLCLIPFAVFGQLHAGFAPVVNDTAALKLYGAQGIVILAQNSADDATNGGVFVYGDSARTEGGSSGAAFDHPVTGKQWLRQLAEYDAVNGTYSGTLTITGISTFNSDVTLANDEIIDNDTDGDVKIIFDDDAANLGQFFIVSSNDSANLSDNDNLELLFRFYDDSLGYTDWGTMTVTATDVSDESEDSKIEFKQYVAGTQVIPFTVTGRSIAVGDTTTGDLDSYIYFADDATLKSESIQWDDGNSRFNLSDDINVTGGVTTSTVSVFSAGYTSTAQTVYPTNSVVADTNVISAGITNVNIGNTTYDANDFIVLPAITSVPVGHTITIVGNSDANCELRTVAASNIAINNVDADGTNEYLITDANTVFIHKVSDAYGWVAYDFDHVGAIVAAHVPN